LRASYSLNMMLHTLKCHLTLLVRKTAIILSMMLLPANSHANEMNTMIHGSSDLSNFAGLKISLPIVIRSLLLREDVI
jgi:hypothetical protein